MGESKGKVIALAIVLMVLSSICVPLRFVARRMKKAPIEADDLMIIPALLLLIGMGICEIIASTIGDLAQHQPEGPNGQPVVTSRTVVEVKMQYAQILIQTLSNGLTKLSILLLYRRIFRGIVFSRISNTFLVIISAWMVGFFLPSVFQCHPISAYWGPMRDTDIRCFNLGRFFLSYAITDLLTDIMILSLPVPMVWGLHMPTRRKIAVSGIFLLGACVVAFGAVRLWVFGDVKARNIKSLDISYNSAPSWYWTLVESSIAIICACLPTLGPIFRDSSTQVDSILSTAREFVVRRFRAQQPGIRNRHDARANCSIDMTAHLHRVESHNGARSKPSRPSREDVALPKCLERHVVTQKDVGMYEMV